MKNLCIKINQTYLRYVDNLALNVTVHSKIVKIQLSFFSLRPFPLILHYDDFNRKRRGPSKHPNKQKLSSGLIFVVRCAVPTSDYPFNTVKNKTYSKFYISKVSLSLIKVIVNVNKRGVLQCFYKEGKFLIFPLII